MPERSGTDFLDALTPDERRALLQLGRRRRFPRGAALFREGERSDGVFLVLEGRVKISYFTDEGREVVLSVRGPGDLLGELSTLDGEPRSASGTAMGTVEAILVPAEAFLAFVEAHLRVGLVLLRMLSRRLREATRRRIEYGTYDTLGRVARRLLELAEEGTATRGAGIEIPLRLSQEELAGWVGASREAVSRALRLLRQRGWVATHRRGVVILELEALRRRAL